MDFTLSFSIFRTELSCLSFTFDFIFMYRADRAGQTLITGLQGTTTVKLVMSASVPVPLSCHV